VQVSKPVLELFFCAVREMCREALTPRKRALCALLPGVFGALESHTEVACGKVSSRYAADGSPGLPVQYWPTRDTGAPNIRSHHAVPRVPLGNKA
jgi:hypothetical protein